MKKKLLFVHHTVKMSGAAKSLSLIIKNLDFECYEPYLLLMMKGEVSKYFEKIPVKIIYAFGLFPFHGSTVSGINLKIIFFNLIGFFSTFYVTRMKINKIKPDLVYLNSTCLFMVAKSSKNYSKKIPIITHIREPLLNNFWGNIIKKYSNKYTDGYISISVHDLSIMESNKKSVVIYNYSDLITKFSDYSILNETKSMIKFIFLGRIRKSNGILELVNFVNYYFKNDNRYNFIIAGFNEKLSKYEKEIISLIKQSSNMKYYKFSENIEFFLSKADVVISPFTEAHFSRAVVEGASIGLPAIISNVKGQNELVIHGETGYIYDKDNMLELKELIESLLIDKTIVRKLGLNARQFALENFNIEINLKKTYKHIEYFLN